VVPIFTYRDERKLFALIGAVIVAASIALVQVQAARAGRPSIITLGVTSAAWLAQSAVAAVAGGTRTLVGAIADAPRLYRENQDLRTANASLAAENGRLREALAQVPQGAELTAAAASAPAGIRANVIGYDPENQTRSVTIDRGSAAGVRLEQGAIDGEGTVGRVVEVEPFSSKVLLMTDPASKVPAVVQRGRWWGIATGTNSRIELQYVSQDAQLRIGDIVVTGEGRSFHAGFTIGRIVRLDRVEGALYQSALIEPAVSFGKLHGMFVLANK